MRLSMKWTMLCGLMTLTQAGCGDAEKMSAPPPDVVGPFTGTPRRFVMDRMELPTGPKDAADDLNGDGRVDNQFGNVVATIASSGDLSAVAPLLAGGRIASSVELISDDTSLQNDATVGLVWHGSPDDPGATLAGTLEQAAFVSNLTRYTTHPMTTTVVLPLFTESDPVTVRIDGAEVALTPDGRGGYNGELHGGIELEYARQQGYRSVSQMFNENPQGHRDFFSLFWDGKPTDGTISYTRFLSQWLVGNVLSPDVQLYQDGEWAPSLAGVAPDSLSLGFRFHLLPCDHDRCAAEVAPSCNDRVRNGDEIDVDCGGSCRSCGGGLACNGASDCQSRICKENLCAMPSCSDGVQDGFEEGVDCGGPCPDCR